MKKILCTTALASTLLVSANALAQTTITGQLDLSYNAKEHSTASKSYRAFGRESQLNIQNKGKLSNGIDYAAGFSWEVDGNEAVGTASFGENTYVDFIFGKTTLTISADHIQNPDNEITQLSGGIANIDDLMAEAGSASSKTSLASIHATNTANSAYSAHGVGIVQDFGVAKASFFYAPDRTGGAAASNDSTGATTAVDAGNSQMEIMIRGDLGVKGLDAFVYAGKSDSDTPGTAGSTADLEGRKYGLSYNFGQFSVAASQSKTENTLAMDAKTTSFGAAFAASKEITVGLIHSKTSADSQNATTVVAALDEKIKAINVGYNLGPVVINAMYAQGENVGGIAQDIDALHLNFTTKF
jgi:hypothetical protein